MVASGAAATVGDDDENIIINQGEHAESATR